MTSSSSRELLVMERFPSSSEDKLFLLKSKTNLKGIPGPEVQICSLVQALLALQLLEQHLILQLQVS